MHPSVHVCVRVWVRVCVLCASWKKKFQKFWLKIAKRSQITFAIEWVSFCVQNALFCLKLLTYNSQVTVSLPGGIKTFFCGLFFMWAAISHRVVVSFSESVVFFRSVSIHLITFESIKAKVHSNLSWIDRKSPLQLTCWLFRSITIA